MTPKLSGKALHSKGGVFEFDGLVKTGVDPVSKGWMGQVRPSIRRRNAVDKAGGGS